MDVTDDDDPRGEAEGAGPAGFAQERDGGAGEGLPGGGNAGGMAAETVRGETKGRGRVGS